MKKEIEKKAYEFATQIYEQGYSDGKGQKWTEEQLKTESEMYAKGLEDAWECARKIVCPSDCYEGGLAGHVKEIFGYEEYLSRGIFKDFSASEAVDKIKEYEEKQKQTNDEIKVGDEVTYGYDTGICTKIDHRNNCFYVMWYDGSVGNWYININKFKKTGRHFSQIVEVLEQMREDEE